MQPYTRLQPSSPTRQGEVDDRPSARPEASPSRWSSRQIFGNGQEVQIAHGESVYRLRITSLGKLILTK